MVKNYYLHTDEIEHYSKKFQAAVVKEFAHFYEEDKEREPHYEFSISVHDDYDCDVKYTGDKDNDFVKMCPYEETDGWRDPSVSHNLHAWLEKDTEAYTYRHIGLTKQLYNRITKHL